MSRRSVEAFNRHGQSPKFNFPTSHIIAGCVVPDKSEEPAHVSDFLAIDDTFKVIELAIKNMPKKEALKDKNQHTVTAHFGPEFAKKVRKQHRGTGNCQPNGKPKSDVMDEDDLERDILACINDVASP
jgi:hypothetical protein